VALRLATLRLASAAPADPKLLNFAPNPFIQSLAPQ
jgi:hypothetical protein